MTASLFPAFGAIRDRAKGAFWRDVWTRSGVKREPGKYRRDIRAPAA